MTDALPADLDVQSLQQMRTRGDRFTLLDVREPNEIATAAIDGSLRIPMQHIAARFTELEPLRNERIIVHCHHGGRSARVADWLKQQGFAQVQNLAGGIDAWSQLIDPTVPRY